MGSYNGLGWPGAFSKAGDKVAGTAELQVWVRMVNLEQEYNPIDRTH